MSDNKSDLLRSLSIDRSQGQTQSARSPIGVSAIAIAIVASLGIGATLGWIVKPRPKPVVTAPPVDTAQRPVRASGLTASGYVVARARATIAAEVTGRVVEVRVEEGQVVRAGDILAVLDGTIAKADSQTAQARQRSAEASVAAAQAGADEAQKAFVRAKSLSASGYASDANLQAVTARSQSAQAQLDLARAQLAAARSDANRASLQLGKFVIRAPFSGVVIDKAAQAGEIISPLSAGGGFTRTGICTIVDMDSLEIEVDVNEAYIGRVTAGQKVEAVLDAYPDAVLPAHVIATIPAASRDKATVRVRIAFDGKDVRILPDMAVKVTFVEKSA